MGIINEYIIILRKVSFLLTKPVIIPKTIGIIKYKIGTKFKITSCCTNSPPDSTRNYIQLDTNIP